ncbi:MAG: riboflavin synthase [Actinobacteria bacterium]|nr:MAG: riboflavin synthase [Actinomycetota bacterium]
MFTGIVEERGVVTGVHPRLAVRSRTVASDSAPGASVSVSGVCLTVVERIVSADGESILEFDLSPETRSRSSLAELEPGDSVNLERAVTLLSRMGGHLVQGHVDGVGDVTEMDVVDANAVLRVRVPAALARYLVEKGSVVLDGVSLTVTDIGADEFGVALVPYTLEATTLGALRPGDSVNVEVDLVAKYVERFMGRDKDKRKDGSR